MSMAMRSVARGFADARALSDMRRRSAGESNHSATSRAARACGVFSFVSFFFFCCFFSVLVLFFCVSLERLCERSSTFKRLEKRGFRYHLPKKKKKKKGLCFASISETRVLWCCGSSDEFAEAGLDDVHDVAALLTRKEAARGCRRWHYRRELSDSPLALSLSLS